MSETLVHYICRLPKEDDCIKLGSYSIIEKEAFKNSTIENILFEKAHTIGLSAFENCKELKFIAWGETESPEEKNYFFVGSILQSKTEIGENPACEKCKEFNFYAWGKEESQEKRHMVVLLKNENILNVFSLKPIKYETPEQNTSSGKLPVLIQNSAFKGCDKLETVIFPQNKCIIEKDAFAHCKSLRTVVLPGGDTEFYDDPFIGCKDLTIICKKGDTKLCAFARAHNFRIIEID